MKKIILFTAVFFNSIMIIAQTNFEGTVKYSIKGAEAQKTCTATFKYPYVKASIDDNKNAEDNEVFILNFDKAKIYFIYDSLQIVMCTDLPKKKRGCCPPIVFNKSLIKTFANNVQAKGYIKKDAYSTTKFWYAKKYYFILPKGDFYNEWPMISFTNGKNLGLGWEVKNDEDTVTMTATKVSQGMVNNSEFIIPADYKVMTEQEYRNYKK
jgi:hypothetical protein